MSLAVHPRTQEFFETFIANPEQSVERLSRGTAIYDDRGTIGDLAVEINSGVIPVVLANHQSFADGLVLSEITDAIRSSSHLEGFRIPGSVTAMGQPLHQSLAPIYEQRGLITIGVYTEQEMTELGQDMTGYNARAALSLYKGPHEGYGIVFLPEADPVGGSMDADGKLLGMQEVTRNDLEGYRTRLTKKYPWRTVAFVPIGIDGSYHIYSPETNTPGELAIKAVCDNVVDEPFVTVNVGELIFADEITGDVNTFLMSAVAKLLPEHARGFYA